MSLHIDRGADVPIMRCPECGYAELAVSHEWVSDNWCGHARENFEGRQYSLAHVQDEAKQTSIGWTAEEYAACPELAGRLHTRILDLQDALEDAIGWIEPSQGGAAAARRARGALNGSTE